MKLITESMHSAPANTVGAEGPVVHIIYIGRFFPRFTQKLLTFQTSRTDGHKVRGLFF